MTAETPGISWSEESPPTSPTPSPTKYTPGCLTARKNGSLKLRLPEQDDTTPDPLSSLLTASSPMDEFSLEVSLKNRETPQRKDLDHLIGCITRELVQVIKESGILPKFRCSGTKFSGRTIVFRFGDSESLEFYRRVVTEALAPSPEHGGFYVRGAGEPPPFRKYRAWMPGEMMDSVGCVPELLSLETGGRISEHTIKVIGQSPSNSNGFVVYFEVAGVAEECIKEFGSAGIMCGPHRMKFAIVSTSPGRKTPTTPLRNQPSPSSSCDNWRSPTSTSPIFSSSLLQTVIERPPSPAAVSDMRRNSLP